MPRSILGNYIQAGLDHRQWTREDLAKRIGSSEATVRRIINGVKPKQFWQTLYRIAEAFEESYANLVDLAGGNPGAIPNDAAARHRTDVLRQAFPHLEEAIENLAKLTPEQRAIALGVIDLLAKQQDEKAG